MTRWTRSCLVAFLIFSYRMMLLFKYISWSQTLKKMHKYLCWCLLQEISKITVHWFCCCWEILSPIQSVLFFSFTFSSLEDRTINMCKTFPYLWLHMVKQSQATWKLWWHKQQWPRWRQQRPWWQEQAPRLEEQSQRNLPSPLNLFQIFSFSLINFSPVYWPVWRQSIRREGKRGSWSCRGGVQAGLSCQSLLWHLSANIGHFISQKTPPNNIRFSISQRSGNIGY